MNIFCVSYKKTRINNFIVFSDLGDHVVVINSRHIVLEGEMEWETKILSHHTGRIGGLREYNAREIHRRDPCQLLWREVCVLLFNKNKICKYANLYC